MRLATFNLESLDLSDGEDALLAERASVLRPELERLQADVLCLQEINGQRLPGSASRTLAALDMLLQGTRYADYHRASTHGAGGAGVSDVHNLVTLSRFPISTTREIRNAFVPTIAYEPVTARPKPAGPLSIGFDRPVLETRITLTTGQSLFVLNVHFKAPLAMPIAGQKEAPFVWSSVSGWAEGYLLASMKRAAQALEVRIAVDRIIDADADALIAVAGDFNAEDHETPVKILVAAEEDTGNGRLAARSLAVTDRAIPQDRRFSVLHYGRPEMLDHILMSRALLGSLKGVEVHNETLADEHIGYGKTHHRTASYHAPVVAELTL